MYCVCTEKKYVHVMIFIYNYNKKIFFIYILYYTKTHTCLHTPHIKGGKANEHDENGRRIGIIGNTW